MSEATDKLIKRSWDSETGTAIYWTEWILYRTLQWPKGGTADQEV